MWLTVRALPQLTIWSKIFTLKWKWVGVGGHNYDLIKN